MAAARCRARLQAVLSHKTPAAQRNFKKAMRGFLDFCMAQNLIKVDPLAGTKLSKMKTLGHHTWTDEEIAKYQAHHAPGTKARRALELLLQTGHARADVVRMGPQHVAGASCQCVGKRPTCSSISRCCPT